MVWENINAGASGSVRPDVYVLNKSFSNPNPITYEIKVSLSDFRSDVTKAKWKSYLDFSYGVCFVVPKGLITKNDLPKGCGLITYNGNGIFHTVKKPILSPKTIDSEMLLKLLMYGGDRMTQEKLYQPRDFDEWKHKETLRKKFGKDFGEKISFLDEYDKKKSELTEIKRELAEILGMRDLDRWCFIQDARHYLNELKKEVSEAHFKSEIAEKLLRLNERISNEISGTCEDIKKERLNK